MERVDSLTMLSTMKIPITDLNAGIRLDKLVVQAVPQIGRARAKRLFSEGRVRLLASDDDARGYRATKGQYAKAGQIVALDIDETSPHAGALPDPDTPLAMVLERDDLVIVDKPAFMP